jgi:RNA polymerase sigma-70 factor (ECF subfamily)
VAYRAAVSSWRKAVNRLRAHHRDVPPPDVDGLSPDHVALVHALRQIPVDQRRVIVLHHLVGLSVDEIAAEVDAPAGTVKARLARGAPSSGRPSDGHRGVRRGGEPSWLSRTFPGA